MSTILQLSHRVRSCTKRSTEDSRIKSLNYLNSILARIEANQAAADEAVLLNHAGRVAEGTVENLFVVHGTQLLTPPVTEGALDGITRHCVMELATKNGLSVREVPLTPYDPYTADECFLTGTGAGGYKLDVKDIDYNILDTGHFALEEEHVFIVGKIRELLRERNIR